MSFVSTKTYHQHPTARARVLDVDDLAGFGSTDRQDAPTRRFGVVLFWAAVACLLAARVALYDPAATRPVGSFADSIAPIAAPR